MHGSQVAQREVEDAALDRRPRQPAIAFCTLSIRLSSIALPPRLTYVQSAKRMLEFVRFPGDMRRPRPCRIQGWTLRGAAIKVFGSEINCPESAQSDGRGGDQLRQVPAR